jgi:exonuclease SbcC
MLLERLTLRNFKRFRNQEIQFRDGITGIIGNNGTGKSSIIEGILFALYGLSGTGVRADFIVSSFAQPRERCEIRLDFRVRGQEYAVRRSFRKGSATQHEAWLNKEGKLLAQGVSEVDREVTRILGMDAKDLKNTIYAGQKDLVALLESRPGERREWFSRVLGIDDLKEKSLLILKERIDTTERSGIHLEGELSALKRQVEEGRKGALEASLLEMETTISRYKHETAVLTNETLSREAQLKILQEEKSRYTRISEREQAAGREIETLRNRKAALEQEIARLAQLSGEYEGLGREVADYPEKKERYEEERARKTAFDRAIQERQFLQKRMNELEKRFERQQEKEREYTEHLAEKAIYLKNVRTQIGRPLPLEDADLERWIQGREQDLASQMGGLLEVLDACGRERERILTDWEIIRQAGQDGICPLCHQRLGDHYPQLETEFQDQLKDIIARAERACEELESQEKEKAGLGNLHPLLARIRALENLERDRTFLVQEREALDLERAQMLADQERTDHHLRDLAFDESGFSLLERKMREYEAQYRRYQEVGKMMAAFPVLQYQAQGILQEMEAKQEERKRFKEELRTSPYTYEQEERLQGELVHLRENRTKRETELAREQERFTRGKENLDQLQQMQDRIREMEQQKTDLEEEVRLLKLTRGMLSEFVVYLMQVVRAQIELAAGEILTDITGGRYDHVLLDNDFSLRISDVDNDYPIERFSGGEQDDIAVAMRIALSKYLAELHQIHDSTFLIFDEIFGSQDEERRNNLIRALRTQESHFPQIILISHIPEIQGEFATTLVVEMDSDQTSVVRETS